MKYMNLKYATPICMLICFWIIIVAAVAKQPSGEGTSGSAIADLLGPKPQPEPASHKAAGVLATIFPQIDAKLQTDIIAAYVWQEISQEIARTPANTEEGKQRRASLQKVLSSDPEKQAEIYYALLRDKHTLAYQAYCGQREAEAAAQRLTPAVPSTK